MISKMKSSFRAILSVFFMLAFAYGMYSFGSWATRTYTDGGSALFLATVFGLFASIIIRDKTQNQKQIGNENSLEKRKRERIDSVLRDLSSEDLLRLKERLNDGTLNDELLYNQLVDDDGELIDGY
jgi:hypothetical protein